VLFDESFERILKPRIYIEIYSAKDKLSVSVEESSSEHKQGLNPERERELHSRTLLQCYKNLIHLSKVALQKQDL
jgi:hypothetical protein